MITSFPKYQGRPRGLTLLAALPAWLVFLPAISAAPAANPAPEAPVQLPTVEVTATKDKAAHPIYNALFDGTFARLRSGPMIEAILWRHEYLSTHPTEDTLIFTTHEGTRIVSATTIYTKEGKLYASSNALGESQELKGLVAADFHDPAGIVKAEKYIMDMRRADRDAAASLNPGDPPPPLSSLLVVAEELGDYRILARAAGPPMPVDPKTPAAVKAMMKQEHADANRAMRQSLIAPFIQPSDEILSWTFQALHDPARAGLVPVALTQLKGQFLVPNSEPQRYVPDPQVLVFDWEGVQYYYEPDVGTWVEPLPINSITGRPDLCVKNGALLECVYLCATYRKMVPGGKAVVLASEPVLAAYQVDDKLNLFLPAVGRFALPKGLLDALDKPVFLAQIRDRLLAAQKQRGTPLSPIPDALEGDDGDLQMRRAYLAFQAVGITSHLNEGGPPSLAFTWDGVSYVYGADQQVHRSPGG